MKDDEIKITKEQIKFMRCYSQVISQVGANDGYAIKICTAVYEDGSYKDIYLGDGLFVSNGVNQVEKVATAEELLELFDD